jgi:cation transport protein ChaC
MSGQGDLWVFGYGSLMWDPGFEHVERRLARLDGHARRFCLRSVRYRGTPESPGLVLGLDPTPGAACEGVAFRVAGALADSVRAYLRERELVTYAYRECVLPVTLHDTGQSVVALTFVVDPAHEQYAGSLTLAEQAAIIATRRGPKGSNRAYFDNTLAHLAACDIADAELEALAALVRAV